MTLTELRCLVAIVEADLNISAAAQNMHSTQPALSRHLKQLEDELGFQIFSRRGRSLVEVTPAGEEVLKIARRVVADVSSLRSYAANHRGDKSGDLLLATTQTYAKHVLPSVLSRLLRRYPELSVHLSPLGEGESLPPVAHNSTDLALVSTAGTEVPDGVAIPLFRWRRVVIVKPSHPLARGGRMPTLAEMAEHPLVTYESSRRPESSLVRALERCGATARFACSAQDADLIKAYVRAGIGVGLAAELSLEPDDYDDFVVMPADPALPECVAWALLPSGRILRNYTLELIQLLAPQIDTRDVRRAIEGDPPAGWPEPLLWSRQQDNPRVSGVMPVLVRNTANG